MAKYKIPLVDLGAQYAGLKSEVLPIIERVIAEAAFIKGKYVQEFEDRFIKMHGGRGGVGCSNGTTAISVALEALGIGEGDEVITSPNTFFATAEGIIAVGAKPVFVDVDPTTFLINPAEIEKAITSKTKAILPVHLNGFPCDMKRISEIAGRHKLLVVEDCAQAHFAKFNGQYVGTFGDAATFSFFPGKNLGAYGDAGFLFVKDAAPLAVAKKLVDHGRESKYFHSIVGSNHRLDGLQAAVLSLKLNYILDWTKRRQLAAAQYAPAIREMGLTMPIPQTGTEAVYHLFTLLVDKRDQVVERLQNDGIEASVHYPIPLHLQPALKYLGHHPGDFPVTERIANRTLSIPIFPEISDNQIQTVIASIKKAIS